MWHTFVDESGNNGRSPAMILGGLSATVDQWKLFSDEWYKELNNAPKVKYFKSSEAVRLDGCFKDFAREEAEAKTDKLASIAINYIKYGVIQLVYNDEFDSIIKAKLYRPKRKLAREMRDPYFLLFYGLVKNIIREQLRLRSGKVDFTFDLYNKVGHQCLRNFNDRHFRRLLPDGAEDILGRAIPGNDEEDLPLQAADLVAGQYRRFISSMYRRVYEPSVSVQRLRRSKKILYGPITKEEMEKFVAIVNATWSTMVLSKIKEERAG